jgi:hypothetical protein
MSQNQVRILSIYNLVQRHLKVNNFNILKIPKNVFDQFKGFAKRDDRPKEYRVPISSEKGNFTLILTKNERVVSFKPSNDLRMRQFTLKGYVEGYKSTSNARVNVDGELLEGRITFRKNGALQRVIYIDTVTPEDVKEGRVGEGTDGTIPFQNGNILSSPEMVIYEGEDVRSSNSSNLPRCSNSFGSSHSSMTGTPNLFKLDKNQIVPGDLRTFRELSKGFTPSKDPGTCKVAVIIDYKSYQRFKGTTADFFVGRFNEVDGVYNEQFKLNIQIGHLVILQDPKHPLNQNFSSMQDLLNELTRHLRLKKELPGYEDFFNRETICGSLLVSNQQFNEIGLSWQSSPSSPSNGVCNAGNGQNAAVVLLNNVGKDLVNRQIVSVIVHVRHSNDH